MNYVKMSMRVQISFQDSVFISFGYIPISGIAGSYGTSIFNFLRDLHIIFYGGYTNLNSIPTMFKGSFFFIYSPSFVISYFLMIVILTGVRFPVSDDMNATFLLV